MRDASSMDALKAAGASDQATELADFASESIIGFDLSGRIKYWNTASEKLYGWPSEAMIGLGGERIAVDPAIHNDQWPVILQEGRWEGRVSRHTMSGGRVTTYARRVVRCDTMGAPVDVVEYGQNLKVNPEVWSSGSDSLHLTAAFWELDVSDARDYLAKDAASRVSELKGECVLTSAQADAILSRIRVLKVNERTAYVFGAYADQSRMIGENLGAFCPPRSRMELADLMLTALRSPLGAKPVSKALASDGILRDPILTAWRSDDRAIPDRAFLVVNGAADDDRSFWYLRASEERYRKLLHFLPTALILVDASHMAAVFHRLRDAGVRDLNAYLEQNPQIVELAKSTVRVTEANRQAVALLGGATPADLIGPIDFLYAASPETAVRVMNARFSGERSFSEIIPIYTLDGSVKEVQYSVAFTAPLEPFEHDLVSMEDVTDRLKAERQLRKIEADFSHAARISTLGEMATSIAHEVNQPLSAIVTSGETTLHLLKSAQPNLEKVNQLTGRIVSSARHASEIVQRIREMALKRAPEHVSLHINEIVDEALLFVRGDVEARSIQLIKNLEEGLPCVVGDRIQLQQVIVNLLMNSIQAIAHSGTEQRKIRLGTGLSAGGRVIVSLHDSGPGISPKDIERIFDSFYTTKETGLGIGLGICQSIVTAHGGEIVALNHQEGGAHFSVSLPVAARDSDTGPY